MTQRGAVKQAKTIDRYVEQQVEWFAWQHGRPPATDEEHDSCRHAASAHLERERRDPYWRSIQFGYSYPTDAPEIQINSEDGQTRSDWIPLPVLWGRWAYFIEQRNRPPLTEEERTAVYIAAWDDYERPPAAPTLDVPKSSS
jgi:hypothetical protein